MLTVSSELKRLAELFEDWVTGRVNFTVAEALQFKRDLRSAMVKVTFLEIGVDANVIDVMTEAKIEAETAGGKVVRLNDEKLRRLGARGGAS